MRSAEYITINNTSLPQLLDCNMLTASEGFYHMDRRAEFNVMIYVNEGKMFVTEEDRDYVINKGELLFLKNGLRHFGKYETCKGTSWLYAHFTVSETGDEKMQLDLPKMARDNELKGIYKEFEELNLAFHSSDEVNNWLCNAKLYEFLVRLAVGENTREITLTDKVKGFIGENIRKDFSVQLVKDSFFLSYSHLASVFKKETGLSMGQYHNKIRMEEACRLLRSTSMTVGEIASELGFSDMLYFSRRFHSYSGLSPTEYRRKTMQEY